MTRKNVGNELNMSVMQTLCASSIAGSSRVAADTENKIQLTVIDIQSSNYIKEIHVHHADPVC